MFHNRILLLTHSKTTIAGVVMGLVACWLLPQSLIAQEGLAVANRAFAQFNYSRSVSGYNQVWADTKADDESRIVAAQRLAYLQWHVNRNYESAMNWIQRASDMEPARNDTMLLVASIESESGHYQAARKSVADALNQDVTKVERRNAINQLALNSIAESKERLTNGKPIDSAQVRRDLEQLVKLTAEYPEDVELAEHQIGLSLISMDWKNFHTGWNNYFRISDSKPPATVLKPVYEGLNELVPKLKKHESPDSDQAQAVVGHLGNSRLFGLAATASQLFSIPVESLSQERQNFIYYADYLEEIENITFEYYRGRAAGKRGWGPTSKKLATAGERVWNRMNWDGKPSKFSTKSLVDFTRSRFGAYRTTGVTNGYQGFYIAHAISDDSHVVKQYGYRVETQVVVLDEMASSDFSGWFLKIPSVGGIALKNRYLEFRRSSLKDAIETWYAVSDQVERERFAKRIERMSESDLARAESDPHAFLPGLSFKLAFRFVSEIYDGLVEQGFQGSELKMKFLEEAEQMGYLRTVIHEGRHVLDFELDSSLTSTELEYRAKLSELAFSEFPIAMLRISIFNQNLGNDSPHGKAQMRILKELVKWMKSNATEIADYDKSKPAVFQLDHLSDENLRQFARSVDPLAAVNKNSGVRR